MKVRRGLPFAWRVMALIGAAMLLTPPAVGAGPKPLPDPKLDRQETRATTRVPETEDIRRSGIARNFQLVGWNPLLDSDRGASRDPAFDPYVEPAMDIPRGSNGDITMAGDCVFVGSFIGYQTTLIVDVSNPKKPTVVGEVPGLPPGVGNGIEGIEASGDLLVIDQRTSLGGLGFTIPGGTSVEPGFRGITVYDIGEGGSDCREPELVARYAYRSNSGLAGDFVNTHLFSMWRDPLEPERVLALQSFSPANYLNGVRSNDPAAEPVDPIIQVIDLTGCPDDCEPVNVANWSAEAQYGRDKYGNRREHLHEAIMSTDGNRIYMSGYRDGFYLLDSSLLLETLRGQASCDDAMPTEPVAPNHCIKPLNADYDARDDTAPPLSSGWHHTPTRVPDRPFVFEGEESGGPSVAGSNVNGRRVIASPLQIGSACPGAFLRMTYVGEDEYFGQRTGGTLLRGDLWPKAVGYYGLEEQSPENCGPNGFKPGTAPLTSSWFSPHDGINFPNIAIWTYYGAGLRAIDISNPFMLRETGAFINNPVDRVRWASYGDQGSDVPSDSSLPLRMRPTATPPAVFAFSYAVAKDGYIIYADVHSGLYVVKYRGPYDHEIPKTGNCLAGNPGAVQPGYEPCAPYGRWNDPRNAWTQTGVVAPPGSDH